MLFSSTTNATAEIGAISSTIFSDVAPFIYFVGGIVLAFFIIEMLISILRENKEKAGEGYRRADRAEAEAHDTLYK